MGSSAIGKITQISTGPQMVGMRSAKIVKIDRDGFIYIDYPGNRRGPTQARVLASASNHIGTAQQFTDLVVFIAFENDDPERPVIVDVIHDKINESSFESTVPLPRDELSDITIDGETVTFDAKKEIVLRCGKSSITLTRAGKVLIRGAYLLNRSSGVNRIKGGSVHIN